MCRRPTNGSVTATRGPSRRCKALTRLRHPLPSDIGEGRCGEGNREVHGSRGRSPCRQGFSDKRLCLDLGQVCLVSGRPAHGRAEREGLRVLPHHLKTLPTHLKTRLDRLKGLPVHLRSLPHRLRTCRDRLSALPHQLKGRPDHLRMLPGRLRALPLRLNGIRDCLRTVPAGLSGDHPRWKGRPMRVAAQRLRNEPIRVNSAWRQRILLSFEF